jgi:hypothetical protein
MMTSMKRMYAGGTPSSRFFEFGCSSFNYDLVPNVTYSTRWGCGLLSCKIVSNGTCFNDTIRTETSHSHLWADLQSSFRDSACKRYAPRPVHILFDRPSDRARLHSDTTP